MLNLSPQTKRFVEAALGRPENQPYRDLWPAARENNQSHAARLALAVLGNLSAFIEGELKKNNLAREQRIKLNNDLWLISDLMEEILEELQETHA